METAPGPFSVTVHSRDDALHNSQNQAQFLLLFLLLSVIALISFVSSLISFVGVCVCFLSIGEPITHKIESTLPLEVTVLCFFFSKELD